MLMLGVISAGIAVLKHMSLRRRDAPRATTIDPRWPFQERCAVSHPRTSQWWPDGWFCGSAKASLWTRKERLEQKQRRSVDGRGVRQGTERSPAYTCGTMLTAVLTLLQSGEPFA